MQKNLKVIQSDTPHIPFHITDDLGNVIATIYHNQCSEDYAELFALSPKIQDALIMLLRDVAAKGVEIDSKIKEMFYDIKKFEID